MYAQYWIDELGITTYVGHREDHLEIDSENCHTMPQSKCLGTPTCQRCTDDTDIDAEIKILLILFVTKCCFL